MLVSPDDFSARFPRPLTAFEKTLASARLEDAEDMIRAAFARAGRDLTDELDTHHQWLPHAVKRVIREMVSAVILVGASAGRRQGSVTAGAVAESWTMADVDSVSWGELVLTDDHRQDLGLSGHGYASGRFPPPSRWPERRLR